MMARPPQRLMLCSLALAWSGVVHAEGKGPGNRTGSGAWGDEGASTTVTLRGTRTPTFTVYKLEKPERLVVDVANASVGAGVSGLDGPVETQTWAVGAIAAQDLGTKDAALARVIVGFVRPAT